jgi:hypothetical protein
MKNLDLIKFLSLDEFATQIYEIVSQCDNLDQFKTWLNIENTFIQNENEEDKQ